MLFWTIAVPLALSAAAAIVWTLLRSDSSEPSDLERDLSVYQKLLQEIDQDLSKGSIEREQARLTRLEVKRRLLRAARRHQGRGILRQPPRSATWLASGAAFLILVPGSVSIYLLVGSPGYRDQPRTARLEAAQTAYSNRPSQEVYLALTGGESGQPQDADSDERLPAPPEQDVVNTEQPISIDELRNSLLEAIGGGDMETAILVQVRINLLLGDDAPDTDRLRLAEMYIRAAGGYVSPEAERELAAVLDRDPNNSRARYFMGLLALQVGRPDRALEFWMSILREAGPEDPVREMVLFDLYAVADLAGVDRQRLTSGLQIPVAPDGQLREQVEPAGR